MTSLEKINNLFSLYEQYGEKDYIGEDVSQLEHMTQAAMLAEYSGQPLEIILSAFLHDIGHLIEHHDRDELGAKKHEDIAYEYLKNIGIYEPIPSIVRGHVMAKRYLVSTSKDYYNKLSDSSKKTLIQQGGILTDEECKNVKKNTLSRDMITVRKYDDLAKQKDRSIVHLNYYKYLLIRYMCL